MRGSAWTHIIEAGFPITPPGDFEAARAELGPVQRRVICGLARTSKQDIEAAWNAIKDSDRPRIHTFIATSDIHIERKLQTTREDVKGQVRAHARELTDDVEFSPEDGSRYMAASRSHLDEGATTMTCGTRRTAARKVGPLPRCASRRGHRGIARLRGSGR